MKKFLSVLAVLAALFFGAAAFTAYFIRKQEDAFARPADGVNVIGRADGPTSILVGGKCSPFDIGHWFLRTAAFFYNHLPGFYFVLKHGSPESKQ